MTKLPASIGLLILAAWLRIPALAGQNDSVDKNQVAQAIESKDINQIIRVLPAMDHLWSAQPKDYFASVKDAAGILSSAANINDKAYIGVLFSNVLEKPFLGETEQALACLEGRNDIVLSFLNFSEVRDSKLEWINIAKYIGKVRGQIDPAFVPKPVARNFVNPGQPLSSEQVEKLRKENENNNLINRFQQSLRRSETILTFQLINNVRRFPASSPTNADFIKSIVAAAHLTEAEQQQIGN